MYAVSLFKGAATALITPFKDGKIDYVSMGKLIEWQINQGIDALVVCGTTGEASTLSVMEKLQLVRFAVDLTDGRVPVIAGSGTNNTAAAADLSKGMEDAGADGLLIVTPYYNRCTESGLISHYEKNSRRRIYTDNNVFRSFKDGCKYNSRRSCGPLPASEYRRYKRSLRQHISDMSDSFLYRRRL